MIRSSVAMDRPVDAPKQRMRRWLKVGVPLLLLAFVAIWAGPKFSRWFSAERSVDASRLRVAAVSRGALVRDLSIQGRVVAAFHPTAFSPGAGIATLEVRAGELVTKDQVLARIESPERFSRLMQEKSNLDSLIAALERQKIEVQQARLTDAQEVDLAGLALDAAKRTMRRAEDSKIAGIINDVDFEVAEDSLRRAELELRHAKQAAELNRNTLDFEIQNRAREVDRQALIVKEWQRQVDELTIRAPVAGRVSRVDVTDRDAVTVGQELMTVVDLSAFEIEIDIPESYVDEIGLGMPAEIRRDGQSFAGEIRSISPEVRSGLVRGIVAFAGEAPQGLRQNQRMSARIVLEEKSDVLKVDRGPFLDSLGGRRAYVVDGDFAVLREIQVGATSVEDVEILSGLEVGEQIVVSDSSRFEGAERVFLRR